MKNITLNTGFTFVELLIVLAVFGILLGAIFTFFTSQRDTYLSEELRLERDQNLRMALETICRELSMAGYKAADAAFADHLTLWAPSEYVPSVPMAVTLDANPKITLGDGELPDILTLACSVPTATNPTTLSEDSGGTLLSVSLSNSDAKKQYKTGDILSIGYLPEYAVVAGVDGSKLTIDTDLEVSGLQPLSKLHPAGSPLGEVSIISYAVFNDENDPKCKRHETGRPMLKRKINAGGFYPVAENISKLKVVEVQKAVLAVSLTARTDQVGFGTGEMTLTSRVSLRNVSDAGFATDCIKPEAPGGLLVEKGMDDSFPCRILLSWDSVAVDAEGNDLSNEGCPVTGYRIYFDSVSGGCGYHADVSPEDASGYILNVSEISSSVFYVAVAAENSGGVGEKSSEAFITDTTPPEKVSGVSATVSGTDEILLSWDVNSECDLAGYYVYRKKDSGAYELASGLLPAGSGGYKNAGLEAGAGYSYKIEAVDFGFNAGEPSDEVTVWLP